ncbi:hypothetical protein [Methylobacterium sp. PvR107]|uniref:hypothetical protein n=1 Tax=Methylobacterium sp. PvR107 TaxID=2806597 RepID=UPI001AE0F81C|nr:hypothetical protein [Methylobacterium sp. PvR107]MBP1183766.1 rSAM-associated Gly-rich repeat protein [Methylobacterium sp. PvR107]
MSASIIPVRPRGGRSALTNLDEFAAELLADGRAANLCLARINLRLTKVQAQCAELAAVIMKRLAFASTALLAALAFLPTGADARGFGGGGFHGGGFHGGDFGGFRGGGFRGAGFRGGYGGFRGGYGRTDAATAVLA